MNGSLRDHAPRNAEYFGLDYEAGEGVDIVVSGLADWNVPDASFDLVMASSVFEHDKAFWRTFLSMCAKAKPGGHIYVSAPSNGTVHRYPKDYWRFYPDAGLALEEWAREEGFEVSLVESFVCEREAEVWNDFSAVFRRGPSDAEINRDFVYPRVRSTNVLTWRTSLVTNPVEDSEDTRLLNVAREDTQRWVRHSDHLNAAHAEELNLRTVQIASLTHEIEKQAQSLAAMDEIVDAKDEELAAFRTRAEDLAGELDQLNEEAQAQARQREQQIRQLAAASGELQSRLAQREEEAAQAWASVDERTQERDRFAAEAEKARHDLLDANGWVERLALTRTQMERRVTRLEKSLITLSRDFERVQQRNGVLTQRVGELSIEPRAAPLQEPEDNGGRLDALSTTPEPSTLAPEISKERPDVVPPELADCKARLARAMAELAETRRELNGSSVAVERASAELFSNDEPLIECRNEVVVLGELFVEAQRRVEELERQNEWLREAGRFLVERGKWWWRFMPLAWQRRNRNTRLLRRNLFDVQTYANRYPDVAETGQDVFRHFIHHGIAENRQYD